MTFHTDAVQAAGKLKIDVKNLRCDLLSISGHKLYGPKGVGALYVKRGARITPLIHGGHHERKPPRRHGKRPGIVGLGKACDIATRDMDKENDAFVESAREDREGLMEKITHVRLNGHPEKRVANTANISFEFIEGESLLLNLDMLGVAASSGSACTSKPRAVARVDLHGSSPSSRTGAWDSAWEEPANRGR